MNQNNGCILSDNIQRAFDGSLCFAGHSVPALAEQYGTPLYLMDEERIRHNALRTAYMIFSYLMER